MATQESDQDALERSGGDCGICLQTCVYPSELPCGHVFCYLCVKGAAHRSKACPLCRQEIPPDFVKNPKLKSCPTSDSEPDFDGYQWFYLGRNGWWQYDERTSQELEAAYAKGDRCCELLIAGYLYIIDFNAMVQVRRSGSTHKRRIKRDRSSVPRKGVAGLLIQGHQSQGLQREEEGEVENNVDRHEEDHD